MFSQNKLHCDNHSTMYSMILKYNISCHMHFKVQNKGYVRFTFVEAMCVPITCSPLPNQPLSSVHELPEFAVLEFADFEQKLHRNLLVGILICIDFYLVLMT